MSKSKLEYELLEYELLELLITCMIHVFNNICKSTDLFTIQLENTLF